MYAVVYMTATLPFFVKAGPCDRFETSNMKTETMAGKTGLWN